MNTVIMDGETAEQKVLREFAEKHLHCWACGWPSSVYGYVQDFAKWLEIHHIVKLNRVHATWNLSRLCDQCHQLAEFHTVRNPKTERPMPYLKMQHILWLKRRFDKDNWSRSDLQSKALAKLPPAKRPSMFFQRSYYSMQRRPWPGDKLWTPF